jgi:hypothetical protein
LDVTVVNSDSAQCFSAAKALIDAGIDINKSGDLAYTPLHVACMQGNAEMVKFLIDRGADMFALSEGDPPFTTARLGGHDFERGISWTRRKGASQQCWSGFALRRMKRESQTLGKLPAFSYFAPFLVDSCLRIRPRRQVTK